MQIQKKEIKISLNNCWLRQLREISWRQKTCNLQDFIFKNAKYKNDNESTRRVVRINSNIRGALACSQEL